MSTKTRLYKVDTPRGPRLIEARSPNHAIVYVVRKDRQGMTATLPPQHELYRLAMSGVEIEVAHGVDDVSEGSQADLAQSNLDV